MKPSTVYLFDNFPIGAKKKKKKKKTGKKRKGQIERLDIKPSTVYLLDNFPIGDNELKAGVCRSTQLHLAASRLCLGRQRLLRSRNL